MNVLTVYNTDRSDEWDRIVRSFGEYDTYWLSGYVKAFRIHGDGEPLLFYCENGHARGINVVMKRDIAKDARFAGRIPDKQYYDLATPYGYGGWITEGEKTWDLFSEYEAYLREQGIVSEFVRFHPMLSNHEMCGSFYDVTALGEVVHMDLSSPETIWNNITSKNRNVIRKAVKNGVKIYNGRFPFIFAEFRKIYNQTMDKDNADEYYYFGDGFYSSILDDLPQNAQVFWAEKDGQVIAAGVFLTACGRMNYHLSGSLREFSSLAPSNLLLYEAALWGCANGCRSLYLGGGVGSGEDSLFKFKRAFYKGNLNRFYIGKKIYDTNKYDELKKLRDGIVNPRFFPEYRG